MPQLKYNTENENGLPGQRYDSTGQVMSALNVHPQAKQIEEISITGDDEVTIKLDGIEVSADAATDALLAEALADAINGESLINGRVIAEVSGTTVTVTGKHAGMGYSLEVVSGPASASQVQAAASASSVPFGRLVILDGHGEGGNRRGRLAEATGLTAQEVVLEITGENTVDYMVQISVDGRSYMAQHTAAGTSAADIATGLASILNALLPGETVLAAEEDGDLKLTSELAGKPFQVALGLGDHSTAALSVKSDNSSRQTDINRASLGVALWSAANNEASRPEFPGQRTGASAYPPNAIMNVQEDGRQWVASQDSIEDTRSVYAVLTGSDAGSFRSSPGAGAVKLERAKWHVIDGRKGVLQFSQQ